MEQTLKYTALSTTVDDFGNVYTVSTWNAIIARMDYFLSGE